MLIVNPAKGTVSSGTTLVVHKGCGRGAAVHQESGAAQCIPLDIPVELWQADWMSSDDRPASIPTALTRQQLRLIETSCAVADQPQPDPSDLCFLSRELVQCNLPASNPGNLPAWVRTNGNLRLVVRPGFDTKANRPLGYPYGSIPRLLLIWLASEATRKKERRIELGHSMADFMRQVGLNPNNGSGRKSDAARLKQQMDRLFRSTISFEQTLDGDGSGGEQWLDMPVTSAGQMWWSLKSPEQGALYGSYIILGEMFYNAIVKTPVPMDVRVVRAIKQSPLALDLYAFLQYRSYRVSQSGKPAMIPWRSLMQQVGSSYTDLNDFRKKSLVALRKIGVVVPDLAVKQARGGLRLG